MEELAAALHRPTSHVYQLTRTKAIPFCKYDGHVVFMAKEVRIWLAEREERIVRRSWVSSLVSISPKRGCSRSRRTGTTSVSHISTTGSSGTVERAASTPFRMFGDVLPLLPSHTSSYL